MLMEMFNQAQEPSLKNHPMKPVKKSSCLYKLDLCIIRLIHALLIGFYA